LSGTAGQETRHRASLRSGARRGCALVAVVVTALLVGGCTVGGDGPDEQTTNAAPPTADPVASGSPEPEGAPEGPSPEELSADLLAATQGPQPLGAVTVVLPPNDIKTTLEVLEIRPVDGATFVELRLTAPDKAYNVGLTTFADGRFGTLSFVRDIYLDDVAGGTRYLPLQFEDYRKACVCPYKPLELGPKPQVVTAVFPALPDGTSTVDVRLASTDLALTGLPVG